MVPTAGAEGVRRCSGLLYGKLQSTHFCRTDRNRSGFRPGQSLPFDPGSPAWPALPDSAAPGKTGAGGQRYGVRCGGGFAS